jgi:DNA-binding transcriptional regulator YdaS (Cro superfamily)
MTKTEAADQVTSINKSNPTVFSQVEYIFEHQTHGRVICSQAELARRYQLSPSHISRICSGERNQSQGWRCLGPVEDAVTGATKAVSTNPDRHPPEYTTQSYIAKLNSSIRDLGRAKRALNSLLKTHKHSTDASLIKSLTRQLLATIREENKTISLVEELKYRWQEEDENENTGSDWLDELDAE